jgi:hypothetical protein
MTLKTGIYVCLYGFGNHRLDVPGNILAIENLAALIVNNGALRVHNIIVL